MGGLARKGCYQDRRGAEVDTAGYKRSKRTVHSQGVPTGTSVHTSVYGVLIRQYRHREAAGTVPKLDALRAMELITVQYGPLAAFHRRNRAKHTGLLRATRALAVQPRASTVYFKILAAKRSIGSTRAIPAAIIPPHALHTPLPS